MYLLIKPLIPSNSCLLLRSMSMKARRQMFRAAKTGQRKERIFKELSDYLNHRAQVRQDSLDGYDFSGHRILVAEDIMVNQ